MSTFFTIQSPAESFFKDRGSKFYGYAYPVKEENKVHEIMQKLRKKHHKARHICYAFQIGYDQKIFRYNDDGEPTGTAGAPILNHIQGRNLTNILVAIVRYFGGTLLGKGGLVNAYGTTAKEALDSADIVEDYEKTSLHIEIPYTALEPFMQIIKLYEIEVAEQELQNICNFTIRPPKHQLNKLKQELESIKELKIIP